MIEVMISCSVATGLKGTGGAAGSVGAGLQAINRLADAKLPAKTFKRELNCLNIGNPVANKGDASSMLERPYTENE